MDLLVKNDVDLRKYISNLNSTFRYDFIAGALADVQLGIISQLFGSAFITALAARHNAATPSPAITPEEDIAITQIGTAIAYLAFAKALPTLLVQMGNTGIYQSESSGTKPVYQWQKIEYENSLIESGYNPIESAIIYLWANRTHTQFALWKDSVAEKTSLQYFVNTAMDFTARYPIANSRRTFEALKPFIREAELFEIKPLIGESLFDDIKTKQLAFNLGPKYPLLIPYLQDAITQNAIARSIGRLTVKADAEGYRVISVSGSGGDSVKNKITASMEQLDMLKREAMNSANRYTQLLLSFLMNNLTDYPLFADSDTYKNTQETTSINSPDQSTVAL